MLLLRRTAHFLRLTFVFLAIRRNRGHVVRAATNDPEEDAVAVHRRADVEGVQGASASGVKKKGEGGKGQG